LKARKAKAADAAAINRLIAHYASQGLLLPRSPENVRAHISQFLVLEESGRVIGCVALEPYGPDLAEVRSLAVDPQIRGKGLGQRLVRCALARARRKKIARVFAVTHAPEFFGQQGFVAAPGAMAEAIPEKVARDCRTCPRARMCTLVAVVATLIPERVALPVLAEAKPAPAV
jgi:amino-acid N-acetyltransferase